MSKLSLAALIIALVLINLFVLNRVRQDHVSEPHQAESNTQLHQVVGELQSAADQLRQQVQQVKEQLAKEVPEPRCEPVDASAKKKEQQSEDSQPVAAVSSASSSSSSSSGLPDSLKKAIVYLTYASHRGRDDFFCRCVESALHSGFTYHLLGWGNKYGGHQDKLFGCSAALESLSDDTVVIFGDAYDVLFNGSPEQIMSAYRDSGATMLFGAEKGCYSFQAVSECEKRYPPSPTNQRFLNTGVWVGPVRSARKMMGKVKAQIRARGGTGDDQKMLTELFWNGTDHDITLDYHSKLIQNLHLSTQDVKWDDQHRPVNHVIDSHPLLLHFNGGSKSSFLSFEAQMWYHFDARAEHAFWHGDTEPTVRLGSIDPHELRDLDRTPSIRWEDAPFSKICPGYVAMRKKATMTGPQ